MRVIGTNLYIPIKIIIAPQKFERNALVLFEFCMVSVASFIEFLRSIIAHTNPIAEQMRINRPPAVPSAASVPNLYCINKTTINAGINMQISLNNSYMEFFIFLSGEFTKFPPLLLRYADI